MGLFAFVLMLVAFFCFLAAAFAIPSRINLTALGLALWVLAVALLGFQSGWVTTHVRP
jgi:hypothetical protein